MGEDDFVEMLLLDGCFIVERITRQSDLDDDLFSPAKCNLCGILRDILPLENQLSFTVVEKLFSLSKDPQEQQEIVPQVVKFFDDTVEGMFPRIIEERGRRADSNPRMTGLLGIVQHHLCLLPPVSRVDNSNFQIRSAIKLKEAGIQFSAATFELKFKDGILANPGLNICKEYESLLRNLIEYEQLFLKDLPHHEIINFAVIMQRLIVVPEDVELLLRGRIIPAGGEVSDYDSEEQIVHIFQTLTQGVELRLHNFTDLYILNDAIDYGSRKWIKWKQKWNRWMENLWDDYFSSPSAFISFVAAVIPLVLTFMQTY